MNDLKKSSKSDLLACGVRAVTSAVPFAGGFLSELIVSVIPNQRLDRVSDYLQRLSERIDDIGVSAKLHDDLDKLGILEKSFVIAARTRSSYKLDKICKFVSSSISDGANILSTDSILLDALDSLTEDEIVCLEAIDRFVPYRNEHYQTFISYDAQKFMERQDLINVYSHNIKYNLIEESLASKGLISVESCSFAITEKGKLLLLKIS